MNAKSGFILRASENRIVVSRDRTAGSLLWIPESPLFSSKGAMMTRLTLDEPMKSRLDDLTEPVEFCDETGRVLGRYIPSFDPDDYEPLVPQVSDDELQRRRASREWYSTADVLQHLEGL